jgi:predicted phage terminase large subunit-like protein
MQNSLQRQPDSSAHYDQTERDRLASIVAEMRRRAATKAESLRSFIPRVSPTHVEPDHLAPVLSIFERVAAGERVRACVSIPPQHGKTETVLHALAWLLSRRPSWRITFATYQQDQSDDKSYTARAIARLAGVDLVVDRQNLRMWRTTRGGGCLFTSVDGPATGQGAQLFVIDDPYKGRTEALSATTRAHVERWVAGTVLMRGQEDMSVVVIHTRWAEDDLIGRIEAGHYGDGWEVVNLPMLADDDGTPSARPYASATRVLNPRRTLPDGRTFGWTLDGARKQLNDLPEAEAAALCQGKPRQRVDGALWRWDWISAPRVTKSPDLRRIVIAVDPATTSHDESDETGIVVAGLGFDGRGYVIEDLSGRYRPEEWAQIVARAFERHRADCVVAETNQGGDMVTTVLRACGATGLPVRTVHAKRGKVLRAEPVAVLYEQGRVSHVGALARLEDQLTTWDPAASSASPDRMDALVYALTEMLGAGTSLATAPTPILVRTAHNSRW